VVPVARDAAAQGRSFLNPQAPLQTSLNMMKDVLSKAYNIDGNGHISTAELDKSAELTINTRKWNRLL